MASTMQLEFSQAMSDFKIMFPDMDRDVIEAVLRANQGAVDQTIDQLLAMSTDNQNEKLRQELEGDQPLVSLDDTPKSKTASSETTTPVRRGLTSTVPNVLGSAINTGASPKIKKNITNSPQIVSVGGSGTTTGTDSGGSGDATSATTATQNKTNKRWDPPLLGPLPANFLRLTVSDPIRTECDLGDEQFALMLQNEEFMAELRWNQEFLTALEKDHHGKVQDDAAFKERLRHMGKVSRKKFTQLAKVFTWQRNKKPGTVRHPDSLLLQEEHSDDDEPKRTSGTTTTSTATTATKK